MGGERWFVTFITDGSIGTDNWFLHAGAFVFCKEGRSERC
jgi:hypothetical protein